MESPKYIHQKDIDDEWTDEQIWEYAKSNNLTIITKDSDFSNKMIFRVPPPRVIHICFGNMKMREFYQQVNLIWQDVLQASTQYKLIKVFNSRIEGIL